MPRGMLRIAGAGALLAAAMFAGHAAVAQEPAAAAPSVADRSSDQLRVASDLDPALAAAGVDCHAERARLVNEDFAAKARQYEVSCVGGGGYILSAPLPNGSGGRPIAVDCLQASCTLTPHVESVAVLAHKVTEALGSGCEISDARYVGYVAKDNGDLYELACRAPNVGLVVELGTEGRVVRSWRCGALPGVECALKPSDGIDPLIEQAERARGPLMITRPEWATVPDARQLAHFAPSSWPTGPVKVVLRCKVSDEGALQGCSVEEESPPGWGWGTAALKMSKYFRMTPEKVNGVPVGDASVTVPIALNMRR